MSKKDLKGMAKISIKILNNEKIKLQKGQKISIKPIVEESLKGAIVSRLEGIIDDNTEIYEPSHLIKSEATILNQFKIADIVSHTSSSNVVPTLVHVCTKKNATDFDFTGEGFIGDLLRMSTLAPVYEKIKKGWKELNTDDKSQFTNIMFVPNLLVFSNGIETLFAPFKVNLLFVSVPTFKSFKEEAPEDSKNLETDYIGRVYADIMDAATKIKGCDNLIINPFNLKITRNFQHDVIDMWNYLLDSPRCRKSVTSIWFTIEDEFNYVLFIAEKGLKKLPILKSVDITIENSSDDKDDEYTADDLLNDIKDEIIDEIESNNDKKRKKIKEVLDDED